MEVLKKNRNVWETVLGTEFDGIRTIEPTRTLKNGTTTPIIPLFPDLADDFGHTVFQKTEQKLNEMHVSLIEERWMDALFSGYELALLLSKSILLQRNECISSERAIVDQTIAVLEVVSSIKISEYERLMLQDTVAIDPDSIQKYVQSVEHFYAEISQLERGVAIF